MTNKIPEGNNVIPTLIVNGAAKAIELYKKAFGAQEQYRMESPDDSSKIMHACITIGNSKIFITDTNPQMNANPSVSAFYVYFADVDATFTQAKQAGLTDTFAPQDMFWGDRMGSLADPFGIHWTVATHVRDVSPEEMEAGRKGWAKPKAA